MRFAMFAVARIKQAVVLFVLCAVLGGAGFWWRLAYRTSSHRHSAGRAPSAAQHPSDGHAPGKLEFIAFPRDSWPAASIQIQAARCAPLDLSVELTGKIALNEDRIAHIFPLVEGRVDEVRVQFGQMVKKGDVLVVVQSKEVGQARLQLFQDRLLLEFAVTKDRWTQSVVANTQAMIRLIREGVGIESLERQLQDRPMGESRDKLMAAFIGHYRSQKHMERLVPLAQDGAISGKQVLEAETDVSTSRATLQSLVEQLNQDAWQQSVESSQNVKELQTRVTVHETNLKILGFDDAALQNMDPQQQDESLSHYPIQAPFDGTIISKDVVLLERVGPTTQILSIADLSSVWVTADIYEEHLPLLKQLEGRRIRVRTAVWPDRVFDAQVFYTGDRVDESSRTLALRAASSNPDGLLKSGMFVNVELPGLETPDVLQVPLTALQDHEGKTFLFVHRGDDKFERRDVAVGRRNSAAAEITSGLSAGEPVVTAGGFALKSRLLAALLSE